MNIIKDRNNTGRMRGMCVAFVCVVCALAPLRTGAAPEQGELRLGTIIGINNAYFVDESRFESGDLFTIVLQENETLGTISSAHFFGWEAGMHLEYGFRDWFALGTRVSFQNTYSGAFRPNDFRIPITATVGFSPLRWLEIQPEVGLSIIYNQRTALLSPNLDTGLRIRFVDVVELRAGFLYGALAGAYFSFSIRPFDIFSIPLLPPETYEGFE